MNTIQILTNLDCNLVCSYCYEHKCNKVNSLDSIKRYLKIKFHENRNEPEDKQIVEIVGGEPFLHAGLLEDMLEFSMEELKQYNKTPYFGFSTNGTLFDRPDVREFVLKYRAYIDIGLSIDGPRHVHNAGRVYGNGKGSYDDVIRNLPFLFKHLCKHKLGVKATFTKETFSYFAESMIHIAELGFTRFSGNVVFENHYDMEFAKDVAEQFMLIGDYLIENSLHDKVEITHFNNMTVTEEQIFSPKPAIDRNFCGSCRYMNCLGFDDKVYGCNRFCTMNKPGMEIKVLEEDSMKTVNQDFIDEVSLQYTLYPEDCQKCALIHYCSTCVAVPYEQEGDVGPEQVRDYLAEKRMCGWTFGLVSARIKYFEKLRMLGLSTKGQKQEEHACTPVALNEKTGSLQRV